MTSASGLSLSPSLSLSLSLSLARSLAVLPPFIIFFSCVSITYLRVLKFLAKVGLAKVIAPLFLWCKLFLSIEIEDEVVKHLCD